MQKPPATSSFPKKSYAGSAIYDLSVKAVATWRHRTERTPPTPNGSTPELILNEARELRRKQDSRLQGLQRLAAAALITLLSAGTIAVAASDDLAPATVVVVFGAAIALAVGLAAVEIVTRKWQEGPNINQLLRLYQRHRPPLPQLQLALINALRRDYDKNEDTLRKVRFIVVFHAAIAVAALAILLFGFRELT